jgi:nicotinamidase-related amidase
MITARLCEKFGRRGNSFAGPALQNSGLPRWLQILIATCLIGAASCGTSYAAASQTVIDEWGNVKAPPPPKLKAVIVDSQKTALLVMDFNKIRCVATIRPRCARAIAIVKTLLEDARARKMIVVHTLSGQTKVSDMLAALAPLHGEMVIRPGLDKFSDTDMVNKLKTNGITRIILTGTSANGAVMFSAAGAVMRGFDVIVPVDGMPADSAYQEQFTAWNLANGPDLRNHVTLTRVDMIRFDE